ncbi:hypothetical protein [Rhodoferax sp.]|uniref:hypothetical protein n=1 Tax=Rhodoferax sp. TaxID=50421 RepID=UPI00272F0B3D|nr:hypothetical protein [Rhodoferax sp.]MDP2443344.1 hypothetical protein [Rhodoferax sp.]
MPITPEARTRLINLFSFFKAVEERRTTLVRNIEDRPWKLRWTELPTHPSLRIQSPADGNEFALTLTRPDIHPCPEPPASIMNWLVAGWEEPEKTAEHLGQKTEFDGSGTPSVAHFEKQPQRLEDWREWNAQRDLWVGVERPARAALRIWERLFSLHSQLMREGEALELVLGDGMFDWNGAHHPIFHNYLSISCYSQSASSPPEFSSLTRGAA